ncbi:inner membrane protein [Salmonella enterica subsp. enterica serovar Heidelberg str. 41573]|nr:inner membrane protein [Salmonella enterica subsp. enterica serovar Heidelberg str. 41573]
MGNDGLFRDSVAYYLYGDEYAAKKLKLRANINNSPISNCSKNTISLLAEELISKALGDDDFNINELFSKIPVMIKKDNRYVSITKEDFCKPEWWVYFRSCYRDRGLFFKRSLNYIMN